MAAVEQISTARVNGAGFVRGATGEWKEPDGTWVGIFLYQFTDPAKAENWADSARRGFDPDDLFPIREAITGVPAGMVYSRDTIIDNGRWFTEAVFSRNAFFVELFVTGPVRHGPQKAIQYAIAQDQLLR